MHARAFTLTELICVLGVLIAATLTLPAVIHAADEASTMVQCAANLSSVHKAICLYAAANADRLPPYRSAWRSGKPIAYPMAKPAYTYHLTKVGDLNPVTLAQQWRGVGMVYAAGFIENAELFYCPAQTDKPFVFASYDPQSGERPMQFGTYAAEGVLVRSGYLWNCWGRQYPKSPQANQGQPAKAGEWDLAFQTLSSLEPGKPLGMDLAIYPASSAAHNDQGAQPPSYNVVGAAGNVATYQPGLAYQASLAANWRNEESPGPHSCWADNPGELNDWQEAYGYITRFPAGPAQAASGPSGR